jgi:hypothetical protein
MLTSALTAAEYDCVPGDCDSAIDYDPDEFDSHADIDYCYGLGEFGYVGECDESLCGVSDGAVLAEHGRKAYTSSIFG